MTDQHHSEGGSQASRGRLRFLTYLGVPAALALGVAAVIWSASQPSGIGLETRPDGLGEDRQTVATQAGPAILNSGRGGGGPGHTAPASKGDEGRETPVEGPKHATPPAGAPASVRVIRMETRDPKEPTSVAERDQRLRALTSSNAKDRLLAVDELALWLESHPDDRMVAEDLGRALDAEQDADVALQISHYFVASPNEADFDRYLAAMRGHPSSDVREGLIYQGRYAFKDKFMLGLMKDYSGGKLTDVQLAEAAERRRRRVRDLLQEIAADSRYPKHAERARQALERVAATAAAGR